MYSNPSSEIGASLRGHLASSQVDATDGASGRPRFTLSEHDMLPVIVLSTCCTSTHFCPLTTMSPSPGKSPIDAPVSKTRWRRLRPAGAPEAAASARSCLRLPQTLASIGQSAVWSALAGYTALFSTWSRANASGPHTLHVHTLGVRLQLQTRISSDSTTLVAIPHKRQSDELFFLRPSASRLDYRPS